MQLKVMPITRRECGAEEWQARVDLAAAHRIANMHGLNEGIFNHLTLVVPGKTDRYYQIPFGTHWSEVKASTFMEVGFDGLVNDGFIAPNDARTLLHQAAEQVSVLAAGEAVVGVEWRRAIPQQRAMQQHVAEAQLVGRDDGAGLHACPIIKAPVPDPGRRVPGHDRLDRTERAIAEQVTTFIEFGGGLGAEEGPAAKRPNLESIIRKTLKAGGIEARHHAAINCETLRAAAAAFAG